jgi:hypothetical protein
MSTPAPRNISRTFLKLLTCYHTFRIPFSNDSLIITGKHKHKCRFLPATMLVSYVKTKRHRVTVKFLTFHTKFLG